jgi:hypothetical protein
MSAWRDRVEKLLYEGETVEDHVEWETASVVVTSHRVLAFTPETEGPNFSQVDWPNVDGVKTSAQSEVGLLRRGVRYGVMGAVLVVTGQTIDFRSIVGDTSVGGAAVDQMGIGGIMSLVDSLLALMRRLDDVMQILGALALLVAAVLVGVYWYTREPTLAIEVAGGEDIHVPRADEDATERLREVLMPDEAVSGGGSGDTEDVESSEERETPSAMETSGGFEDLL